MRQRAMIAIAIACNPVLLIADEPTTALDVTIQAQIIVLLQRLREQLGLSIIWITHDLGVVARLATRVVVMQAGRVVEEADVRALFAAPRSAYTRRLLDAVPRIDRPRRQERDPDRKVLLQCERTVCADAFGKRTKKLFVHGSVPQQSIVPLTIRNDFANPGIPRAAPVAAYARHPRSPSAHPVADASHISAPCSDGTRPIMPALNDPHRHCDLAQPAQRIRSCVGTCCRHRRILPRHRRDAR